MSNRITKRNDQGRPLEMRCDCGVTLHTGRPGGDVECQKCGAEYNSAGQRLNLTTSVASNGVINFVDTGATNHPYRFYRVQMSP